MKVNYNTKVFATNLKPNESLTPGGLNHIKKHLTPHIYHTEEYRKLSRMIANIT